MVSQANLIESLIERVEVYRKTTFELSKLKILEKTCHVAASLASRVCVIIVIFLFTLALNIGIALLLGEMLGKLYYGFFIVAAFYLVAGMLLHFFIRKWIKKAVSNLIIKQVIK